MSKTFLLAGALALCASVACNQADPDTRPAADPPREEPAAPASTPGAASPAPAAPSTSPGADTGIGDPVPAFTATLVNPAGDEGQPFDSRAVDSPVAYVVLGTTCPSTRSYVERLHALEGQYAERGVRFIYVYPNRNDTSEAKLAFHREHQLGEPLIDDQEARIARLLGAAKTTEVILVDREGTIVYRGAIDDSKDASKVTRQHLAVAMDETLAGNPVGTPKTQVFA